MHEFARRHVGNGLLDAYTGRDSLDSPLSYSRLDVAESLGARVKIITLAIALVISLSFGASTAFAGELSLSIHDGLVTLVAKQVTVREILAEWARVGQVTVVGADKAPSTPVTIQLTDVPEQKALETILRAASGYVVAQRATLMANASRYDRILVMPPSTAPAATPAAGNAAGRATPAPVQPPVVPPQMQDIEPADDPDAFGNTPDPAANAPGVGSAAPGAINPGGPPETQFNYANPQQMMQFRQQTGIGQGGAAAPVAAPSFFPGTATAGQQPQQPAATSSSQPGVILQPQQTAPQFRNPYGLPNDAAPGSQAPPQNLEPDRSKYANPYQPTPPPARPPDQ